MKFIRERPSQRRHHRVTAPILLSINDKQVEVINWSLGGLLFRDPGKFSSQVNQNCTGKLSLPFQGFQVGFDADLKIVRIGIPENTIAVKFESLGDREKDLLEHFIQELIRGSMVAVDDTIQRIDVPVTPVSTKPDPNPVDQIPIRRWPLKTIAYSAFYICLGAFVFGYLGLAIFAMLFRIETDAAVLAAETATITAPSDGQLTILFAQGSSFNSGEILATVQDRNLNREINAAKLQLAAAEARYAEQLALQAEAERRSEGYRLIAKNNIIQSKTLLAALQDELVATRRRVQAMKGLRSEGWATQIQLDEAQISLRRLESEIARKKIHLAELQTLTPEAGAMDLFNGDRFVGEVGNVEATLLRTTRDIKAARSLLDNLNARREKQQIRAPWPGRIVMLHKGGATHTRLGEEVMILERDRTIHVKVFLSQRNVKYLRIGDPVDIFLTATDERIIGSISSVDRTKGFFDEANSEYQWQKQDNKTALVTVMAPHLPAGLVGTPAIVLLRKRWSSMPAKLLQRPVQEKKRPVQTGPYRPSVSLSLHKYMASMVIQKPLPFEETPDSM